MKQINLNTKTHILRQKWMREHPEQQKKVCINCKKEKMIFDAKNPADGFYVWAGKNYGNYRTSTYCMKCHKEKYFKKNNSYKIPIRKATAANDIDEKTLKDMVDRSWLCTTCKTINGRKQTACRCCGGNSRNYGKSVKELRKKYDAAKGERW